MTVSGCFPGPWEEPYRSLPPPNRVGVGEDGKIRWYGIGDLCPGYRARARIADDNRISQRCTERGVARRPGRTAGNGFQILQPPSVSDLMIDRSETASVSVARTEFGPSE